jgi:hypothetical protein
MAAMNARSMQSFAKRSTNGSDCTKPKADRFPDPHLFAKSKRLSDFIVESEKRYWLHPAAAGRSVATWYPERWMYLVRSSKK